MMKYIENETLKNSLRSYIKKRENPEYSPSRADFYITWNCSHARCRMCGLPRSIENYEVRSTPEELGIDVIRKLSDASPPIKIISFMGGEPTTHKSLPLFIREAANHDLLSFISSDGSWGTTPERARKYARTLEKSGLDVCGFSLDSFHQEKVPLEYVINAGKGIVKSGINCIQLTTTDTRLNEKLNEAIANKVKSKLSEYAKEVGSKTKTFVNKRRACRSEDSWSRDIPHDEFYQTRRLPITACISNGQQSIGIMPDGTIKYCGSFIGVNNSAFTLGNSESITFKEAIKIGNEKPHFKLLSKSPPVLNEVLTEYGFNMKAEALCIIHSKILSNKSIVTRADEILDRCKNVEKAQIDSLNKYFNE